jgi:CheY-like chemotaxis protein
MLPNLTILIVEDGDEYRATLSRFLAGPRWLQAHSSRQATEMLARESVDLVYLDMRFDRIPRADLCGDHEQATRESGGDPERGWKHLALHQGVYVLDALRQAGFGHLPVVVSYDFTREPRRFAFLQRTWPRLAWVPDDATASDIAATIKALLGG